MKTLYAIFAGTFALGLVLLFYYGVLFLIVTALRSMGVPI